MDDKDNNRTRIHFKTDTDAFGKKTVTIRDARQHGSRFTIFATVLAVLIGVSVPYFLLDAGETVYEKVSGKHPMVSAVNAAKNLGEGERALGSDDSENIPDGQEMLINDGPKMADGQYYFQGPEYKVPATSALAYVVADLDTGEIIVDKNPDKIFPIASISKLITALVAKERMNQHDTITVTRSSINIYGTYGGLRTGEKILVADLYYPLLMESSNDAADVFARGFGYERFVDLMNAKADDIGMPSTSFDEPSGLSENNVSTANDLLKLTRYITKKYPEIWDISRVRQYSILGHSWSNGSLLARRSDFAGGKNGYTNEANRTTVTIHNVNMEGGPRRIAVTLLYSGSRENDVAALLRFVARWTGFLPAGQTLANN